jgi:hypothetical protein
MTSSAKLFERKQLTHFRDALGPHAADEVLDIVLTMTRSLLDSGSGLVKIPAAGVAGILATALMERRAKPRRLHAQIELAIARSFAFSTDEMADRCLDLARIALPNPPGDAVARFLQRLGRCYIAGFYPEAVIVCRAVLENAVVEKFQREKKPLPVPQAGKSEMRARLARAEDHRWLTRTQVNDAWSIWDRGSKAAHRDPHVTSAVLETVRTTMELLRVLYT